jgi:ubiquitin-protein ligase
MTDFVHYTLVNCVLNDDKKSKIDSDKLMEPVDTKYKKSDALFSQGEVASSIIKELYKVEKNYPSLTILDIYNLELNNFCIKFPEIKIKLIMDKDYYPLLTPDISLDPPIDPLNMYEMLSHPDLNVRNMSKIRNISYIISKVGNFLENYNGECKFNYDITNNILSLLKNNNYKMKLKDEIMNDNIIKEKPKTNGIGYGGNITNWDVNAYLDNLHRIKELNIDILSNITIFINNNKENKDLYEIHEKFNLNTFWIDLLEKYEISDEKYYNSIYNIMLIINHLSLKIKIPFLDLFESLPSDNSIITKIKEIIPYIKLQDTTKNISNNEYVSKLQLLQVGDYPYVAKQKHNYVNEISKFTNFTKNTTTRYIIKQFEVIAKSLPITSESAIFFRRDPNTVGLFKFAVIPNEDTPYKYGFFVFDVFLPENYPDVPPIVNHSTSRKNNFRFNPNLYSNGFVCLSILGTWTGDSQSTKWIPLNSSGTGSTLYQVIMSIYSMVFSEEPWYNEPGRERDISNAKTNNTAIGYNKEIRDGTIRYAILNQLRYPEEGFEDAIKTHFRLKKDNIIAYLNELNKQKDAELFASLI